MSNTTKLPPEVKDRLYRLDIGDPDSRGCTITLGEYLGVDCLQLEDFIANELSLQQQAHVKELEKVREQLEAIEDWVKEFADEQLYKVCNTCGDYKIFTGDDGISRYDCCETCTNKGDEATIRDPNGELRSHVYYLREALSPTQTEAHTAQERTA